MQPYFNFIGKINNQDLVGVYQSHEVFVHLSQTGSVDKSLLEAMACGLPVLSANESSGSFLPEELIFHKDDAGDLAVKIKRVSKLGLRDELRQYVVKNHNLDNLIEKISAIIKS